MISARTPCIKRGENWPVSITCSLFIKYKTKREIISCAKNEAVFAVLCALRPGEAVEILMCLKDLRFSSFAFWHRNSYGFHQAIEERNQFLTREASCVINIRTKAGYSAQVAFKSFLKRFSLRQLALHHFAPTARWFNYTENEVKSGE